MKGLGLAAMIAVAGTGEAQPQVSAPRWQSAEPASAARFDAAAVVAEVRQIIAARYVLPEKRPALDAVLAEGLASGRYRVSDPATLAERINADLDRVGRDRHLNFRYDPAQAALSRRGPGGPLDIAAFERQARNGNHGVRELRLLPGNVRYLNYDGFQWIGEESAAALDVAMRFLAGGEAVIIDLRRNGGGSPAAVRYLISHFVEAGRPLVTFYMNGDASADTIPALDEVPAGRMVGKPLYLLVSGSTNSAAEEFTGHVAGYRLGELVGENTSGGGFRNEILPIQGGFLLSVSVGRAVLASTGRDWEGVGHAPTIPAPVENALEVAQVHALRRLAAGATGNERVRLTAMADGLAAASERRAPGSPQAAYLGSYGGRVISLDGGELYYRRDTRPRERLVALGGNEFAFASDPSMRLTFTVNGGQARALEINPAGQPSQGRYERTR